MIQKRTKAKISGGPVHGQPAASKRRSQKTTGTNPQAGLRRSLRIQKIQESCPRRASHDYSGTPTSQASVGATQKQQSSPPPSRHNARPRRACAPSRQTKKVSPSPSSHDYSLTPTLSDDNGNSGSGLDDEVNSTPSSAVSRRRQSTSPINIKKSTRRPNRQRLIDKSPLGSTDVVTWTDDSNGILQDCHVVTRAHAWQFPEVVSFNSFRILHSAQPNVRSVALNLSWRRIQERSIWMARATGSYVRLSPFYLFWDDIFTLIKSSLARTASWIAATSFSFPRGRFSAGC